MARIHGRRGVIYLDPTGSAAASPLNFAAKWSISFSVDTAEVTAFGDGNKTYVAGLPDASGDFSGFYDDATVQTYTAATDGLPRKWYLYPNSSTVTQYFFGNILPDFSLDGAVGDAVSMSSKWVASGPILKQG